MKITREVRVEVELPIAELKEMLRIKGYDIPDNATVTCIVEMNQILGLKFWYDQK